jgi:hypothetical protein
MHDNAVLIELQVRPGCMLSKLRLTSLLMVVLASHSAEHTVSFSLLCRHHDLELEGE